MVTFEAWKWNNANGGMRFAFPPYGLTEIRLGLTLGQNLKSRYAMKCSYENHIKNLLLHLKMRRYSS
jgi:hypothetical protein